MNAKNHPIPPFAFVTATYLPSPATRPPSSLIPFVGAPLQWMAVPPNLLAWAAGSGTPDFVLVGGGDGWSEIGGKPCLPTAFARRPDLRGMRMNGEGGGS